MTVVATGFQAVGLAGLRTLISECAAFQTWVGADNAAEALASIYVEAFDTGENLAVKRPFCLIGMGETEISLIADQAMFATSVAYSLQFERYVPTEYLADPVEAGFDFLNGENAIIEEIQGKSDGTADDGTTPYVRIASLEQAEPLDRSDVRKGDVDGDRFRSKWTVELGGWNT